jgi:hypothetical protein
MLTRTTVDIPSPLFRELKARAAEQGETLRIVLTRAIEVELGHRSATGAKPPHRVKLPLIRHKRGPKLRITNDTIAQSEEDEDLYRYKRSLRQS